MLTSIHRIWNCYNGKRWEFDEGQVSSEKNFRNNCGCSSVRTSLKVRSTASRILEEANFFIGLYNKLKKYSISKQSWANLKQRRYKLFYNKFWIIFKRTHPGESCTDNWKPRDNQKKVSTARLSWAPRSGIPAIATLQKTMKQLNLNELILNDRCAVTALFKFIFEVRTILIAPFSKSNLSYFISY